MAADDEPKDPLFEALWARVLEAWDDDKAHAALIEYAVKNERLPDAAGRYRAIKDGDPARAERAKKKLDAIVIAATQMMMAMKTATPMKRTPWWLVLLAAVIMIGLLAMVAQGLLGHRR